MAIKAIAWNCSLKFPRTNYVPIRKRQQGQMAALTEHKRGRPAEPVNPLAAEIERLRRENQQLLKRMEQLELLVDIQKNLQDPGDYAGDE